ncbi:1-acyl-sn-glycerol-3-phosphate acyltransferase [Labilibaculum sp.]|uniref:1-acyl-sn-glycerol-3-phosphate acyltransferase n=1 Tax=Labilibaculum sp. TaxID=2060723 RepID=UPI002AA696E1|nr:1-acyl-sn-glycerol-3-phosphate acyltransferase [Labilibaculum sp.]MBN2595153.1 1-acyl-sn-glycerol-3-phosphate acyltransferase [Marinifilaceae bacterium]
MKAKISKLLMQLFGWKYIGDIPQVKKAVVIAVPHTSNWDFVWGKLALLSYNIPIKVLMKKEMFVFPLKYIWKSWGVIPVNRSVKGNMTDELAKEFASRESLYLSIAPEGSRSLRSEWKKGFYYIALKANVPIYLAEINYEEKTLTCGEAFYPTGDVEKDMITIKSKYINCKPKYPENFTTGL